jgi:hypothetical protein
MPLSHLLMPIYPASEDQHQKMQRQRVHRSEFRPTTTEKWAEIADSMLA